MVHSLTPLAVALRHVHVFTQPGLYKQSLWLPYRRKEASIREAVAAAGAAAAAGGEELKAIFAHADVVSQPPAMFADVEESST